MKFIELVIQIWENNILISNLLKFVTGGGQAWDLGKRNHTAGPVSPEFGIGPAATTSDHGPSSEDTPGMLSSIHSSQTFLLGNQRNHRPSMCCVSRPSFFECFINWNTGKEELLKPILRSV
jgi:hypothetical protein